MKLKTKIQMKLLQIIIARFKSKSPAGYAMLAKICGIGATVMGAYILVYNGIAIPPQYAHILGVIDNDCVVAGAALSALGLGAASTTTDAALVSKETKQNVIDDAINKK